MIAGRHACHTAACGQPACTSCPTCTQACKHSSVAAVNRSSVTAQSLRRHGNSISWQGLAGWQGMNYWRSTLWIDQGGKGSAVTPVGKQGPTVQEGQRGRKRVCPRQAKAKRQTDAKMTRWLLSLKPKKKQGDEEDERAEPLSVSMPEEGSSWATRGQRSVC